MNWSQRAGIGLLASGAITLLGGCYSGIDSADRLSEISLQRPRQASYEKRADYYIDRGYKSWIAALASAPLAMIGACFLIAGTGKEEKKDPKQLHLPFEYPFSEPSLRDMVE